MSSLTSFLIFRYALLDTLDELSEKKGQEGAALSSWFKGFVSSHLAVFEGPSAVGVGDEVILSQHPHSPLDVECLRCGSRW
jgi:hypothetical protein